MWQLVDEMQRLVERPASRARSGRRRWPRSPRSTCSTTDPRMPSSGPNERSSRPIRSAPRRVRAQAMVERGTTLTEMPRPQGGRRRHLDRRGRCRRTARGLGAAGAGAAQPRQRVTRCRAAEVPRADARRRPAGRLRPHGHRQLPHPPRRHRPLCEGDAASGVGARVTGWFADRGQGRRLGALATAQAAARKSTESTRPRPCSRRGPAAPSTVGTRRTGCRHST